MTTRTPSNRDADGRLWGVAIFAWTAGAIFLAAAFFKMFDFFSGSNSRSATVLQRFTGTSEEALLVVGVAEAILGAWLLSGVCRRESIWFSMICTSAFAGVLVAELGREQPRRCGCFGSAAPDGIAKRGNLVRRELTLGIVLNGALSIAGASFLVRKSGVKAPKYPRPANASPPYGTAVKGSAFSIAELLVAIGIVTILLGILLPAAIKARESARRTRCQSNLRQIGIAFQNYQSSFKVVPRWARYYDAHPMWLAVIPPMMGLRSGFDWPELRTFQPLACPSHPLSDIPSSYVLNVFAFDTKPEWKPSTPISLARVKSPSDLYWVMEATATFGPSPYGPFDGIYFEPHHIVSNPENLQRRVEMSRHRRSSNVLFADGHVQEIEPRAFNFERLDDGIQSRRWPTE